MRVSGVSLIQTLYNLHILLAAGGLAILAIQNLLSLLQTHGRGLSLYLTVSLEQVMNVRQPVRLTYEPRDALLGT